MHEMGRFLYFSGLFLQKMGFIGRLPLPGATLRVRKHALNSRGAYFQTRRVLTFLVQTHILMVGKETG